MYSSLHLSHALEDQGDNHLGRCFKGISRYDIVMQSEKASGNPVLLFFGSKESREREREANALK